MSNIYERAALKASLAAERGTVGLLLCDKIPALLCVCVCVGVYLLLYTPLRDDERAHRRVGWVPGVHGCKCVCVCVCVLEERERVRLEERLKVFPVKQGGKVDQ